MDVGGVPGAGVSLNVFRVHFESAIGPTFVGVVNPVFSFTLTRVSRVLSQAELSREQVLPRQPWAPR